LDIRTYFWLLALLNACWFGFLLPLLPTPLTFVAPVQLQYGLPVDIVGIAGSGAVRILLLSDDRVSFAIYYGISSGYINSIVYGTVSVAVDRCAHRLHVQRTDVKGYIPFCLQHRTPSVFAAGSDVVGKTPLPFYAQPPAVNAGTGKSVVRNGISASFVWRGGRLAGESATRFGCGGTDAYTRLEPWMRFLFYCWRHSIVRVFLLFSLYACYLYVAFRHLCVPYASSGSRWLRCTYSSL